MATKAELREQLSKYDARFAAEFRSVMLRIASRALVRRIEQAIANGDFQTVLQALEAEPGDFTNLIEMIRSQYIESGQMEAAGLPKVERPGVGPVAIQFNIRNPAAERWLAEQSSRFITQITQTQRAAIRVELEAGMIAGTNPRDVSRNLVGTVNTATGLREGGIVGLHSDGARAVQSARNELLQLDASYFRREKRDRRFDAQVRRAIASGQPLSKAQIDKITGRYADRLLKLRGDNIARTEMLAAFSHSRDDALRQLVESGRVRPEQIRRVWTTSADERVRMSHRGLSGESVGLREPFVAPSGAQLMHPGDQSLGAPASEIINCRCFVQHRIDFLANL